MTNIKEILLSAINKTYDPINNIEYKTNKDLSKVFLVTEIDKNSQEWKEFSYTLLQNLYIQIVNLDSNVGIGKIQDLLKQYIIILKNSDETIQDLFSSRLIQACKKNKSLSIFVRQIKQDWWLLEFWKRRFHIE